MESTMIETALLVAGFGLLCLTIFTVQGMLSTSQMVTELQEQVAVWGTSIMVWMTFSKCHCK